MASDGKFCTSGGQKRVSDASHRDPCEQLMVMNRAPPATDLSCATVEASSVACAASSSSRLSRARTRASSCGEREALGLELDARSMVSHRQTRKGPRVPFTESFRASNRGLGGYTVPSAVPLKSSGKKTQGMLESAGTTLQTFARNLRKCQSRLQVRFRRAMQIHRKSIV